jgi:hypothetical protein
MEHAPKQLLGGWRGSARVTEQSGSCSALNVLFEGISIDLREARFWGRWLTMAPTESGDRAGACRCHFSYTAQRPLH